VKRNKKQKRSSL